jgi:hypothetical protein
LKKVHTEDQENGMLQNPDIKNKQASAHASYAQQVLSINISNLAAQRQIS